MSTSDSKRIRLDPQALNESIQPPPANNTKVDILCDRTYLSIVISFLSFIDIMALKIVHKNIKILIETMPFPVWERILTILVPESQRLQFVDFFIETNRLKQLEIIYRKKTVMDLFQIIKTLPNDNHFINKFMTKFDNEIGRVVILRIFENLSDIAHIGTIGLSHYENELHRFGKSFKPYINEEFDGNTSGIALQCMVEGFINDHIRSDEYDKYDEFFKLFCKLSFVHLELQKFRDFFVTLKTIYWINRNENDEDEIVLIKNRINKLKQHILPLIQKLQFEVDDKLQRRCDQRRKARRIKSEPLRTLITNFFIDINQIGE